MLKRVQFIDYNADYAYSPPERDAVINLSEIVSIVPIERGNTRRPFDDLVSIRFRDGSKLHVIGKPEDFVPSAGVGE